MKLISEKINSLKITLLIFGMFTLFLGFLSPVLAAPDGCSDVNNGWNCQEWEGFTKYTCPNAYAYSRIDFATNANYVRGYTAPAGNWATSCSVGCADPSACGDCECRCYGNDLYCADRWTTTSGVHVAQSCSFKATNLSDARCVPVASFDPPTVVNGSCGTKSGTFVATTTAATWNAKTYCASGTNTTSPAFPAVGASTSWTCARGAVSATGVVNNLANTGDPGSLVTAWRWVIRTVANDTSKNYTNDIKYSTQSFSISTLAPDTYKVYLAVQRRGVWSAWVSRQITVSNASCTATRSYYTCGGAAPNGTTQIMCPSDNASVTVATNWANVGATSTLCTAGRKCEYYTPAYSCTGNIPHAHMCPSPNDDSGLTVNTAKVLVPSCGYDSGGASIGFSTEKAAPKCQVICDSEYHYDPSTKTCVADSVTYLCGGTYPNGTTEIPCSGDSIGLIEPEDWHKVNECSSSVSEKCEYYTPAVVKGDCGVNARIYPYTATGWIGTTDNYFCDGGTPDNNPDFPGAGESKSWICEGLNPSESVPCAATRQRNLNWQETSPSN